LRRALPLTEKPELFAAAEEAEVEPGDFLELDDSAKPEQPRVPAGDKTQRDPFAGETPDERQARITGYKQRYDWLQVGPGDLWFGRIENADRYGLGLDSTRAAEPFSFVRLDPETGRELFANVGAPPLSVERERATSFGFADTIANGIELRARRLAGELTRGSFDEALALGAYCVRNRLEAPRALVIAEDLYQRAVRYDPKDPAPRLGLARCLEAAFQFEQAFATYEALLLDFAHREEVHVAMAELEAKLLLHDAAEQRLRAALTRNQGSWITRFGLGRFLLARGRASEAHEHLKVAWQAAPQVPELADVRATIRTTLADAQFALGELAEAESTYRSALAGDAKNERARAGLLACETLAGKAPAAEGAPTGAGFELLLARGVADLANAKHESARDLLRLAAEADPLRAHKAYGALSVLAEVTGNGEEALRLADEALERDPTDAFALFQRGRLLGLQDDYEGARAALSGALEQELDFTDALIALGDVAFRLGRFDDAERYLERAVALDGARAEVHA
ncbi:MAG: tetratricopeptide repeat protein, partial [Planctomycetota bacterium]